MAFTRVWGGSGNSGTQTTHAVDIGSPANGDDVVVHVSWDGAGGTPTSLTFPAGWTKLKEDYSDLVGGGTVDVVARRLCDGTEGATINVTSDQTGRFASRYVKVTAGHSTTQAPEIAAAFSSGNSTGPDAPSLTPTGGSKAYLWCVFGGKSTGSNVTLTAAPTNYGNAGQSDGGAAGAAAGAFSYDREVTGSSEDPGAGTLDAADGWCAITVAFYPAEAAGKSFPIFGRLLRFFRRRVR